MNGWTGIEKIDLKLCRLNLFLDFFQLTSECVLLTTVFNAQRDRRYIRAIVSYAEASDINIAAKQIFN